MPNELCTPDVAKDLIMTGFWYGFLFGVLVSGSVLYFAYLGSEDDK